MMVKCPVCGAHVPQETAVECRTPEGPTRYCSLRCAVAVETEREKMTGPVAARATAEPAASVPPPRELVVAVDGSGPSLRAVELAASIARATGGRLVLIHAIDPALVRLLPLDGPFAGATRLGVDIGVLEERLRRDGVRQLEHCGALCEKAGVPYEGRVVMEPPARAIAEAAEKADLVVLGRRGIGAFTGVVLGSVSHRVLGETRKPVLVVP